MKCAFRPAAVCTLLAAIPALVLLRPASLAQTRHGQNEAQTASQTETKADAQTPTILRTTVRRVVLDVVVTDREGNAVPGLTKDDFAIKEDGQAQRVLSFEPNGFNAGMDFLPPTLPPEPPNTFINLPTTPEKGPLYILLYDLNNMDNEDQMALTVNEHQDQIRGRQQLMKFIQSKPEGARFEIYVWSDGLHLLQGFTSDKALLYSVIDPKSPRPHIPQVYLMGQNTGRGNPDASLSILNQIGSSLDGLPGRKNLIWFAGGFPLQLFPSNLDGDRYIQESKATLDLLARNQIAIYPVDVRGVVYADFHSQNGITNEGAIVSQAGTGAPAGTAAPSAAAQSSAGASAHAGNGLSLIASSYQVEDEIAQETGGHAFYGNNDVAGLLAEATETGGSFYTLTYSPTNHDYNGDLRHIEVHLEKKGYTLAYRRSYYGTDKPALPEPAPPSATKRNVAAATPAGPRRPVGDSLSANMQLGAPVAHQLVFGVQVHPAGAPAKATPQEMAALATEPAFFKLRRRLAAGKPLPPVPLQHYTLGYRIFARQFNSSTSPIDLEIAAAAYDADGHLLNALVNVGSRTPADPSAATEPTRLFRVDEDFEVPTTAAFLRFAVRDTTTDRLGAMEIKLPLAPEPDATPAATPTSTPGTP